MRTAIGERYVSSFWHLPEPVLRKKNDEFNADERESNPFSMAQSKVRERRVQQLKQAARAIATLRQMLQDTGKKQAREKELASHLDGFYQEIEKLAKGKALIPVTDLVVNQANDIIRDSKSIIQNDTYLDRVKEFVPAGDNPVYPDVLIMARTVQQSLNRSQTRTEMRRTYLSSLLLEANTIRGALVCYIDYQINSPSKEEVGNLIDGKTMDRWFPGDYSTGYHFDFHRLDRYDLDTYLSENRGEGPMDLETEDEEPFEEESDDQEAEDEQ